MNYNITQTVNGVDEEGNPIGGAVWGTGLRIDWQNGPRGVDEETGELEPANGAFVEDAIFAAKQRLGFFNTSRYRCRENSLAITKLEEALHWLDHRRQDRAAREVEGQHIV
jgi:hypothetical protein